MKIQAHAKINWTLNIIGKRQDGYHLMDMVMQSLALHDEITLNPSQDGKITLTIENTDLKADESNLVVRAARKMQERIQTAMGVHMHLIKHIPMGAGLGGGSADAAAVLRALRDLWQTDIPDQELYDMGLTLGADVPYCLFARPARVQGIGEKLQPIQVKRNYELVLIQPCEALSTRDAFNYFDSQTQPVLADNGTVISAFSEGNSRLLSQSCKNVMQPASEKLRPQMGEALSLLEKSHAFLSQMTGSGSVVFGAYESEEAADEAFQLLRSRYPVCIRTRTV